MGPGFRPGDDLRDFLQDRQIWELEEFSLRLSADCSAERCPGGASGPLSAASPRSETERGTWSYPLSARLIQRFKKHFLPLRDS
jgi:hypothetical protein